MAGVTFMVKTHILLTGMVGPFAWRELPRHFKVHFPHLLLYRQKAHLFLAPMCHYRLVVDALFLNRDFRFPNDSVYDRNGLLTLKCDFPNRE